MKSSILLGLLGIAVFSSCSVYKTGQTPDDVYYSPAKPANAYVATNQNRSRYQGSQYDNPDDYWLRMRVRDPYRWSMFDNYYAYDYRYNSWAYNSYGLYNPYSWNSYWMWNSYYNPYSYAIISVNPKTNPVSYNRVRNFSLSNYSNTAYNNQNSLPVHRTFLGSSGYNNKNQNSLGNTIRKVFSSSPNYYNGNNSGYRPSSYSPNRPVRTYTPSSSSGGGSRGSSSGGGGGGVSRPGRGGGH